MTFKKEIIAEEIRNKIIAGKLKEGKQVLGRVFAVKHRTNLKTAHEAIWTVEAEGFLYHRSGAGYYVAAGAQEMAETQGMERIQRNLPAMVAKAKALGLSEEAFLIMVKNAYRD